MLRIAELRKECNQQQKDVAIGLGIGRTTYNQYETGKRTPDLETLIKIANYFNVSTDYLLGNADDPTPPGTKKESHLNESVEAALVRIMRENNIIDENFTMSKRDALRALEALKILTEKDDNDGD